MATRYVWSGATGSGTGADWTNAYTTLAAAVTAAAAGDDIRVAHDHDEVASSSAAVTYTFPGTRSNPLHVVCVNRTTGLPATTGRVKTVGSYNMTLTGTGSTAGVVVDGMTFRVGETSTGNNKLDLQRCLWLKNCTVEVDSTTGGTLAFGPYGSYSLVDSWVKFASVNGGLFSYASGPCNVSWTGGGVLAGTNATALYYVNYDSQTHRLADLDLSLLPAAANIFSMGTFVGCDISIRDSRLPSGWSGSLVAATPGYNSRVGLYNCDAGDTNYNLWIADHAGSIVDETAIYRTDGAKIRNQANAAIGYALKCTTNSNTAEFLAPLKTDPMLRYYPGTTAEQAAFTPGASKTVAVEIAHSAAAALTNAQAWLEVEYLNTDAYPQGDIISTQRANVTVTATTNATSTEAWSGTAQTYRQKLTATITPQAPGLIQVRVCLATANGVVVYVDPTITVS